jgi:hypothetical protein
VSDGVTESGKQSGDGKAIICWGDNEDCF